MQGFAPPRKVTLDIEADVQDLEHEELFQSTVKSCIPGNETGKQACGQFIPLPKGNVTSKVQRVALIAPPGQIYNPLLRSVERIVERHNSREDKKEFNIELFQVSHVPPYGYGKTHGLTKVLRLVPQPLTLEVTGALQSLLEPGETHAIITLADLKAGLRQILRFHCRLSHLAAHTAIMSVEFNGILDDPRDVISRLRKFLVPVDAQEDGATDDEPSLQVDDDHNGLFQAEESYGTQVLSHIQQVENVDVNQVLDSVLLDELQRTNNLSRWPCEPFWASGEPENPTEISVLVQRLAAALSPACDDAYVNCWVARDKCEAKRDGICSEAKH